MHRYARHVSRPEVVLATPDVRGVVLASILDLCRGGGGLPVALAVCRVHVHLLAELPVDRPDLDRVVARLKTRSSASIRDRLPGRVWARGNKRVLKRDRPSQLQCLRYILAHAGPGAATWRFTPKRTGTEEENARENDF